MNGGSINGYTAKTALILLPNGVGGYISGLQVVSANENRQRKNFSVKLSKIKFMRR